MKLQKVLLAASVLLLCTTFTFAHGKSDVEEQEARNLNSWTETFDLEGKKKGKFNIVVTAKDKGGNTFVEGPYNIMVDPDSDLCVPGITNPYPNMRVVGNLNIVGTCVDDDGVDHVELVLDGNEDTPIRAEGSEFWSYYLDTVDLEEGPHTIKVTGYDINGLKGKSTSLTWQLDRRQPITQVQDKTMGILVSGNVHFAGRVDDGNGIRDLLYSIDNGENFHQVNIKNNTKERYATFDITVNTREFKDGPAVIWFKATDNAGSTGIYSFLYFIDNTKPDVKIISPAPDREVNGKFSVAGFAKDTIGITSLTYTYGNETGEIELIPGNPYWCLNFDATNSKEKAQKFSIKAKDRADNVVEVVQTIKINSEADKPVVTIVSPEPGMNYFDDADMYVRGIAVDDDGVKSVRMILDAENEVSMETRGSFYFELPKNNELSTGKHKVTVIATDVNGVDGNPVVVEFQCQGEAPKFGAAQVAVGKETLDWTNAMEIHPESGSVLKLDITSTTGIKNIHTEYSWKKEEVRESDVPLKNLMAYTHSLPITNDLPKGLVQVSVTATDIFDRTSEYKSWLYITNTSVIKSDEPKVIFEDSRVDEEGRIVNDLNYPATGYVIGAEIKKAELSPATKFATLETEGNLIKLIATDEIGTSEPVVVKVTTAKNDVIESRPLIFVNDTEIPTLEIENHTEDGAYTYTGTHDLTQNDVKIRGKAACKTGLYRVQYRVLKANVEMKAGVLAPVKTLDIPADFTTLELSDKGEFEIIFGDTGEYLGTGAYLVEFVAESNSGNKISRVVALNNIPELEEDEKGKIPKKTLPQIVWFDGLDVYARNVVQRGYGQEVVSYEEDLAFKHFPRAEMNEGANALTWDEVVDYDTDKPVLGKFTANKMPTLSANFAYVNDQEYKSGMTVEAAQGADAGKIVVYIETGATVTGATYEIYGDEIAGGDVKQTGAAKLIKPDPKGDSPNHWEAEIPLKNLSSRITKVKLAVKAGGMEKVIEGAISVVRYVDDLGKDDEEKVYTMPKVGVEYIENTNTYNLGPDSEFYYYANLVLPIKAELVTPVEGLELRTNDRLITLKATKDAEYKNVKVRVTDGLGDIYESPAYTFLKDSGSPDVVIETPKAQEWLGNNIHLSGTAADSIGVFSVEYSLDNGVTWDEFSISGAGGSKRGVTYSKDLEISHIPDGLVQIDIRATDTSGNTKTARTYAYKDVTPPNVTVVQPLPDDIVNGENLIVFEVTDNAILTKAEYVAPGGKTREDMGLGSNLISMLIGTKERPIEEAMSFVFTDEAGNKNEMIAWKFLIDNESDLPISEIHLPEDNQVITRDFTISGVIYDDDGESTIFYKLDDQPFKQIPEMGTSYSIDVPLSAMTDNEHTVTVYAVDINGVKGPETVRKFRISLEEPKGAVVEPTIDTSVRELVTIKGVASDKNGIAKIMVSLDNGNSYNDAIGTEEWSYSVDTRAIPGGTQVVFLKVFDNYGIQGLYSSLINIDNEAPKLNLELPLDDSTTTGNLFFSGYSYDNVEITNMYVTIRNLESRGNAKRRDFKIDRVIGDTMDITDLDDGFYNIELTAEDKAGNRTNVSRNIHLEKNREPAVVDLLYPLNGEHKTGKFNLYGQANSELIIQALHLFIDGKLIQDTRLTKSGFFKFTLGPEDGIEEGVHEYYVEATLDNNVRVKSRTQTLTYSPYGPWISIDNFAYGDFATKRPFLRGEAGYSIPEDDLLMSKTKEASKEFKAEIAAKAVSKVEISFDNGKTFETLSDSGKWAYRIENEDMSEGYHFLFMRATMKNGETAIERTIIQIDNTKPMVTLISPLQGGNYNQTLEFSGLSGDDIGLESVTLALRKGDKASYALPSFIQGLFVDVNIWGATLFDIGAGLTFFDDNVKLQLHWGQFTQQQRDMIAGVLGVPATVSRYGGNNIFGLKLLANISTIPFSYFLGHDWEWLYASFAIGAKFSYFDQEKPLFSYVTNAAGQKKPMLQGKILSAILAQAEFPRIHFANVKMFSTISMYTEGAIWFIPSDVSSPDIPIAVPTFSVGFRLNVF